MTVTEIQPVSRMKMRIFLDGESAFVISPAQVHKWGLYEGKSLDSEQERILMHQASMYAARTAVELLAQRDYTAQDLRQKLRRREFSEQFTEFALEYVQQNHYQDDMRFAESYIRSRGYKYSRMQIRAKLMQKGIDGELIDRALQAADHHDTDSIRIELDKRFPDGQPYPPPSDPSMQRFMRSMIRKGYSYRELMSAMRFEEE